MVAPLLASLCNASTNRNNFVYVFAQGTKVRADTAAVIAIFTANVANVSEP
jgi:hypothetical protein